MKVLHILLIVVVTLNIVRARKSSKRLDFELKEPLLPLLNEEITVSLPDHFDAREEWPDCPSIGQISDLKVCPADRIAAAVEVMSDRICIYSNGSNTVTLSTADVVNCCQICPFGISSPSCSSGYSTSPWTYWLLVGIVTGGGYKSNEGCVPFDIVMYSDNCDLKCTNPNYTISYKNDLHFGATNYSIPDFDESIQQEIMTRGPVEAIIGVFQSFQTYESGIYVPAQPEPQLGSLAIRIIGWGHDDTGSFYWLGANSWGTQWGEKGFFRFTSDILTKYVFAGTPKL